MRKLYAAWIAGSVLLFLLAYWKNSVSYSYKSWKWRATKSFVDSSLVALAALKAPALLVAWTVLWLTRPIARRGVQTTLAVIFGITFGAIGGVALEVLCVLGIFAIDLLTGVNGIYGWWKEPPPDTFMPYLVTNTPRRQNVS